MKNLLKIAVIIAQITISSALLAACGGGKVSGGLTPMPAVDEPSDAQLAQSVQDFMRNGGGPVSSAYRHERIDLNGDGKGDALVILKNPYGYWCGMYGCTMLIMKAKKDSFDLVNAVQTVREPLYVMNSTTDGWRNIVIHVSGRWTQTKDVILRYDGDKYPTNPSELPPYGIVSDGEGVRLFN
jgi:hypothetical protein